MPEQKTQRGQPITTSAFEAPFETHITRYGLKGLNLNDAIDAVEPDELTRMLNVTHRLDFGVTSRPGQTSVSTGGTLHHSIRRLNNPVDSTFIRVHGIDTDLYTGTTGALTLVDSGYSGDPLTMLQYHPYISEETWMLVADRSRMRQVRSDGLDLSLGLPTPSVACTTAKAAEERTTIADFSADGTQPTAWTGNKGFSYDDTPLYGGLPIAGVAANGISGSAGIYFLTTMGEIKPTNKGYYSYWGVPKTLNLGLVGSRTASDEDYIHLYLNFSHTQNIKEFRIYFVCSSVFSPSVVPGISDASGANADSYVKSFSANDFAAFVQAQETQLDASEAARLRSLKNLTLTDAETVVADARLHRTIWQLPLDNIAAQDPSKAKSLQASAGSDQWQEFSTVGGSLLRRGDFQRLGTTPGRDWSTITGIVCFVITGDDSGPVEVRISDFYMTGGYAPDSGEAPDAPFDYRYTNYDTRTGDESNPSPIMADALFLDSLRRKINITPVAYGDGAVRQKIFRRGGTLVTDWFYLGMNSSDGGVYADDISDTDAAEAGAVEIDNHQPIPTVDTAGTTVLAQPLPSIWGPLEDFIFGCGDPYRPGTVYFSKPGRPGSWPPNNHTEVCSPSEALQAGFMYGPQAFVFSKERLFVLYPNLSGDTAAVTSATTQCTRGLINRWGWAVGQGGAYFVSRDGIYRTAGGPEEWVGKKLDPLFRGKTVNGYYPIDFTQLNYIRLSIHESELYFQYMDTNGSIQCMVYSILFQYWRAYHFGQDTACFYSDEGNATSLLLIGGKTSGTTYSHTGFSDAGTAIPGQVRNGAINFNRPREEKRLGDQIVDVDTQGVDMSLVNYLNWETVTNPTQALSTTTGRKRTVFDGFGTTPQRCVTISTDLSWSSSTAAPVLYLLGTAIVMEPDMTVDRVTQWDDLGSPDAVYLTGITLDVDTGGVARTILVETDYDGAITTVATLTVNSDGRHKYKFSWAAVLANKVRIRPSDTDCIAWILYKADWIFQPEPPIIAKWDVHFENGWDQYYTGLDLYCDTFGLNKTIEVYVDGVLIKTVTVNTNGRLVKHITLPWGRGHVFRFIATDANVGILYTHRWQLEAEPSEQTNWNQNFTVAGTETDKYLKALVFQCDTFGLDKSVTVECDGVVVQTLTVNSNGRKVIQKAFSQQLGRVFRIYPTDDNPGRLYSVQWIFDQEPLALDRWETQEVDHTIPGWHYPIYGHITLKSSDVVTLTLTGANQLGTSVTKTYAIPSTSGAKTKVFVPFEAMKGILFKYIFTCPSAFWLYREESSVAVRVWGSDATLNAKPFGNDDQDTTRIMTKASLAAARQGGGAG